MNLTFYIQLLFNIWDILHMQNYIEIDLIGKYLG